MLWHSQRRQVRQNIRSMTLLFAILSSVWLLQMSHVLALVPTVQHGNVKRIGTRMTASTKTPTIPVYAGLLVERYLAELSSTQLQMEPTESNSLGKDNRQQDEEVFSLQNSRQNPLSQSFLSGTAKKDSTNAPSSKANYAFLDDLTPPPINMNRDSILFSDNPATKRNNNAALDAWTWCASYLPPVVTGVWAWRDASLMEGNPVGAIYNMMVVRLPTIAIAMVYSYNLYQGHPLIMDIGQGAFEVHPILVLSVLAFILA